MLYIILVAFVSQQKFNWRCKIGNIDIYRSQILESNSKCCFAG